MSALAVQSIEGMYHAHFDPREFLFHVFRGQRTTEALSAAIEVCDIPASGADRRRVGNFGSVRLFEIELTRLGNEQHALGGR